MWSVRISPDFLGCVGRLWKSLEDSFWQRKQWSRLGIIKFLTVALLCCLNHLDSNVIKVNSIINGINLSKTPSSCKCTDYVVLSLGWVSERLLQQKRRNNGSTCWCILYNKFFNSGLNCGLSRPMAACWCKLSWFGRCQLSDTHAALVTCGLTWINFNPSMDKSSHAQ